MWTRRRDAHSVVFRAPRTNGQIILIRLVVCFVFGATIRYLAGAPYRTAPHHTTLSTTNRHGRHARQVEKTQGLMGQTERKASAVVAKAEAHTTAAKGVAQASERQEEALREAIGLLPSVEAAVEQALGALRYVAVRLSLAGCTAKCSRRSRSSSPRFQ